MKMDIVAGSGNDEFYTPAYAIKPILKYIKPGTSVACPFDTEQSLFVKMLKEHGCRVHNTHIDDGFNFFEQTFDGIDLIVSNPPYSVNGGVQRQIQILIYRSAQWYIFA